MELLSAAEIEHVGSDGDYRSVRFTDKTEVIASALLLAPGSVYKRLGVPGEEDFIGAGVHFCATCDGPFYRGREVLVIGGGNSAVEEGVFLTRYASKVTILVRDDQLTASAVAINKALENPNIVIRYQAEVASFTGSSGFSGVTLTDGTEVLAAAAFVFIGLDPNTAFLRGLVDLRPDGFITTSDTLQTSLSGVFAAGDARAGSTKQLVSAAGEGATAALMIRSYLSSKPAALVPTPLTTEAR